MRDAILTLQGRFVIPSLIGLTMAFGCAGNTSADAKGESALLSNKQDDDNDGTTDEADEADASDAMKCATDADCDPDETCVKLMCSNNDGEQDDDGPGDRVVCAIDTDCDPDETCVNGRCSSNDGEKDDNAAPSGSCNDDNDNADDDKGARGDDDNETGDDGPNDRITCAIDTDCDPDETCSAGLCVGTGDACTSNADCDSDEACTNGVCEDA